MANTDRAVEVHESRIAGGLRIAVAHPEDHGLLEPQHIVEIPGELPEQWQFR